MTQTMSKLPSIDGFDVKAAVARMLGEPELWWQALALFDTHFGSWDSDWRTAQGDIALERRKVHSLRSAAANIGAVRLALDAEVLETFLLANPDAAATPTAQGLRRQLQHEFDLARDGARQALVTRQVMAH